MPKTKTPPKGRIGELAAPPKGRHGENYFRRNGVVLAMAILILLALACQAFQRLLSGGLMCGQAVIRKRPRSPFQLSPARGYRTGYRAFRSLTAPFIVILGLAALTCQPLEAQIPQPREVLQRLRECVEYRTRLAESDGERAKAEALHEQELKLKDREIAVAERERDLERRRADLEAGKVEAQGRRIADLEMIVAKLTERRRSIKCLWLWHCGRPGG